MAMTEPLENGRFGNFGGMFVPETLIPACQELEKAFNETDWNIIEDLIESLQYEVDDSDTDGMYPWHNEDGDDEID